MPKLLLLNAKHTIALLLLLVKHKLMLIVILLNLLPLLVRLHLLPIPLLLVRLLLSPTLMCATLAVIVIESKCVLAMLANSINLTTLLSSRGLHIRTLLEEFRADRDAQNLQVLRHYSQHALDALCADPTMPSYIRVIAEQLRIPADQRSSASRRTLLSRLFLVFPL